MKVNAKGITLLDSYLYFCIEFFFFLNLFLLLDHEKKTQGMDYKFEKNFLNTCQYSSYYQFRMEENINVLSAFLH